MPTKLVTTVAGEFTHSATNGVLLRGHASHGEFTGESRKGPSAPIQYSENGYSLALLKLLH
jgi:hypothetical protein